MGAGALIRDPRGRPLIVEPTYKGTWELPGGAVEVDESPRAACDREVQEELGIRLPIGRLLCLEWQGPEPDRSESLMFVYDAGVLPQDTIIRLPEDELASVRFVETPELDELMVERLARRVRAALSAWERETLIELEDGIRLTSH